jgi:RHS repeat-associated protein
LYSLPSYNGFGQISQLTYGNGTITDYSYATGNTNKATTLMGSTVLAKEQGASVQTPILSRDYTYNKQGMVRKMIRNVAGSLLSQFGTATFTDTYAYDRFGRLDGHEQLDGSSSIYTLDMDYNKAGSITFKNSNGSSFMNATALTYGLEYNYDPSKDHQLDHIWDPASGTTTSFKYNTSGSITQIDDPAQAIPQDFFWNEQQQLTGVKNQQGVHHYIYDHQGERLMKSSLINTSVYLNDQVIDNVTNLDPYTVYVNPFYVVTGLLGGDLVSKHYYMNQQRVATDITINYDSNGTGGGQQEQALAKDAAAAAPELSPALANFNEVLAGLGQKPLDTASLKLPTIASYYPEAAITPATSSSAEGNPSAPRILFWYHPDYLGNVDLITERDGNTHEFFMYNPWGEEMHQWNANTYGFTSPYRFNSKELDPETGLAYYGARYYQNKIGVWLSVDPKAEAFPNVSSYSFNMNNPIMFIDPGGDSTFVVNLGNNKYKVVGVEVKSGNRGVYEVCINEDGNRELTGHVLGNSLTSHSFVDENENAVKDAIIDLNSNEASDIVNGIYRNTPSSLKYGANWQKYNYKGDRNSKEDKYRGAIMPSGEIASMRDVGNYVAGYTFGNNGWPLSIARIGFERLQATNNLTDLSNIFGNGSESRNSVLAQNRGWLDGYKTQLSRKTGRKYD